MNIRKNKSLLLSHICILLVSFTHCGPTTNGFARGDGSSQLNETALLFAGKDLPKESKLHAYIQTAFYKSYQQRMVSGWNRLQGPNLQMIRDWWKSYRPSRHGSTVLYPFSGPDIMNALTFFPDADNYIMFGLEAPGVIPEPHAMSADQITRGLNGLSTSLGDVLHMNFFKTEGMAAEMSSQSFNSIAGIIMYFLATNGYTVVDARKIAIDAANEVVTGTPSDDRIDWQNPPNPGSPGLRFPSEWAPAEPRKSGIICSMSSITP